MTNKDKFDMQINTNQNLLRLLPEEERNRTSKDFPSHVNNLLRYLFANIGGVISSTAISPDSVSVQWKTDLPQIEPYKGLEEMLNKGQLYTAVILLELFLSDNPDNEIFLYNLGMAYSDLNELDDAIFNLEKLLKLKPDHTNGRIAYGVALMRKGENSKALDELKKSIQQDENNPWGQRNIGACYMRLGRYSDALPHLKKATKLSPKDQRAWFGLGQAYEYNNDFESADKAYHRVIDIDEFGELAEQAKQALSELAEKIFKSRTPEVERMDGVMYCLGALQTFANMSPQQVRQIGVEIAMVGMSGIKVNNPEVKYTLKSLPGTFTGLHLLCLEYVAFKQVQPDIDIGFDLSKEYATALSLNKSSKKE